ncbi:Endothelial lipase, partial [Orchesella cincta]
QEVKMSIAIKFSIIFGIIVTSCFISVYCAASVDVSVDSGIDEKVVAPNRAGNFSSSNRGLFARCFGSIWSWMKSTAEGVVEDKIISGNPDNVHFYLYPNAENKDLVEEIVYGDVTSLQRASFRFEQPWKIIIHGFTNHHISEPVQQIKNAYLTKVQQNRMANGGSRDAPGYNVVVVDWGMLADPKFSGDAGNLFYNFAVKNVPLVGRRVGEFVLFLMKNGALQNLDQVHLLGFSLGSHVSGNAGNTLRELTGQVPGRITGLDPAGPSFYSGLRISSRQLSTEDAKFVDIIHTNQGALGIYKNIGHADFYRNSSTLVYL